MRVKWANPNLDDAGAHKRVLSLDPGGKSGNLLQGGT